MLTVIIVAATEPARRDKPWEHYAPARDAVCLVFDFEKLRQRLNATMQAPLNNNGLLLHGENRSKRFFSINHGIADYVDRAHALRPVRMANRAAGAAEAVRIAKRDMAGNQRTDTVRHIRSCNSRRPGTESGSSMLGPGE
jgi:hypothetical protein